MVGGVCGPRRLVPAPCSPLAPTSVVACTFVTYLKRREQLLASVESRQGWWVLGACLVAVLLGSGVRSSFTAFMLPMEADLGWDRSTLSNAASLNVLVYGFGQLPVGFLVDHWGPRRTMVAGLLVMALSAYGTSQASEPWQLYLYYGLLNGLAWAGAGLVPASALLLGWFPRRPALAVGVASSALPAGQALFVPLAAAVIPLVGWRLSYLGLGLSLAVVAAPLLWLLARNAPRTPFTESAETVSRPYGSLPQRGGLLVIVGVGFLACGLTDQLVTVHLVPFASGLGLSPVVAAGAQSVMTLVGIAGSVAAGRAADSWSPRAVTILHYLVRAATFPLLLLFAVSGNAALLYAFALIFGPTYIANVGPAGRMLRERYGQARVGSLMGITQFVHQVGAAVGVSLGGWSFTLAGSYAPAFVLATAASLVGAAASLALPRARRSRPEPDSSGRQRA